MLSTSAQRAAGAAAHQLGAGSDQLAAARSPYGVAGLALRRLLLRAGRHLATRQRLVDAELVGAVAALSFDTAVAHRGASSFPGGLDPAAVIDIDSDVGRLFVHADDRVITPWMQERGDWEPAEAAFLRDAVRPGATMLDVGANIGYMSVLGSRLVGPEGTVIAVEPEERNLAVLRANLWRHGCANVVVLPIAASARQGYLPLAYNELNRGDHQTGRDGAADRLVPSAPLDALLDGRPVTVIKLDTQGYDHEVLAGLRETVHRHRPRIMAEFWLEGMTDRGVDAAAVAEGYARDFELGVLDERGRPHPVDAAGLVRAAADAPGQFVNVVLTPGG